MTTNLELRETYEKAYGRRVSDPTWYKVKRLIKSASPNNQVTEQDLIGFATTKNFCQKLPANTTDFEVSQSVQKFRQHWLNHAPKSIKGSEFLKIFKDVLKAEINPDRTTIYRWFYQSNIPYFRKKAVYTNEELLPVAIYAYCYCLRNTDIKQLN